MSINDLLAFASGAQLAIESNAMVTVDDHLAERTGLSVGTEWLAVSGYRRATAPPHRSARPSTTSTALSPRSAGCCNGIRARSSR